MTEMKTILKSVTIARQLIDAFKNHYPTWYISIFVVIMPTLTRQQSCSQALNTIRPVLDLAEAKDGPHPVQLVQPPTQQHPALEKAQGPTPAPGPDQTMQ